MKEQASPLFFIALLTTLFLGIFYNTVTNMAGIYIVSDLGGSRETSVYLMAFFGLGNVLSFPLVNPIADRIGPIKLLIYGLLLFIFFSILCSLASTFVILNLYRIGLGFASGIFYILARRLLLAFSPPEKIDRYTFFMIVMYVIVPVLGVCFGAWLGYESRWRWIFYVNEPIALFLAAFFWIFYRKNDPPSQPLIFDKVGYLFFSLAMGSLITAATLSQELDWQRSSIFLCLLGIGIPSFIYFILRTLKRAKPLLELKLLRSFQLSYSFFNLALLFSAYFGMIILIALWLNIYVNYTPNWISILIFIMAIGAVLAYFVTKDLLRYFDPRFSLALAIIAFAISSYYSTYFDVNVDFFHLAVARFLAGLGLVLFLIPIFNLSLSSYGPEKSAPIFTLLQVIRSVSTSLGAALYVILWQRRQIFFHERLGENLTQFSEQTSDYFQRAVQLFGLSQEQAKEQLDILLNQQATSLALNDCLGLMSYLMVGLFALLIFSFIPLPSQKKQKA